jgi:hypothetical protein
MNLQGGERVGSAAEHLIVVFGRDGQGSYLVLGFGLEGFVLAFFDEDAQGEIDEGRAGDGGVDVVVAEEFEALLAAG